MGADRKWVVRLQLAKLILAVALTPLAATVWRESVVYLILLSQITWVDSAFSSWMETRREAGGGGDG